MKDFAIETVGLRRSFHGRPALTGLDMRVPWGSIWGFLGRNGAGKTTTIKILMGILKPHGGSARVLGMPLAGANSAAKIRQRIGFVTEDKELYPYMTVRQVLRFTRSFFPNWRDDLEQRYLRMFELPPDKKIPDLSKGMRSKLMLLLAMSRGAELLILDEPTDGLDPVTVEEMLRELVSFSATEGTTIFFSSHQLSEVEQIADHIMIVDHGRGIVSGSLDDLKGCYQRVNVMFREEPASPIQWLDGVERVTQHGRLVSLLASKNVTALVDQAKSLPGARVELTTVTLKEIFLEHAREQ
jgi:ABC-2 type transport system ATP-binding protein